MCAHNTCTLHKTTCSIQVKLNPFLGSANCGVRPAKVEAVRPWPQLANMLTIWGWILNIIYLFHLLHTSLISWPPTHTLHHHTGSPRGPQSTKGHSLVLLYNDSYVDMAGTKHPRIFGQQGSKALGELWSSLGLSPRWCLEVRLLDVGKWVWRFWHCSHPLTFQVSSRLLFFEQLTSANLPEELYQTWCFVHIPFSLHLVYRTMMAIQIPVTGRQWFHRRHYNLVTQSINPSSWIVPLWVLVLFMCLCTNRNDQQGHCGALTSCAAHYGQTFQALKEHAQGHKCTAFHFGTKLWVSLMFVRAFFLLKFHCSVLFVGFNYWNMLGAGESQPSTTTSTTHQSPSTMTPVDQDILHLSIGRQAFHRGSKHMDSPSFFPLALMISFFPACNVLVNSCNLRLCRLFWPAKKYAPQCPTWFRLSTSISHSNQHAQTSQTVRTERLTTHAHLEPLNMDVWSGSGQWVACGRINPDSGAVS